MPGLIASSSSSTTDNSEWAFNLRDSSRFYYYAYSNLDSDSESASAPTNKPASHAQLLKDLDLSTRGDTAVYTANPWTIAKQNAACRETSAFVSNTTSKIGIGFQPDKTRSIAQGNPLSVCDNIPKTSAQTTLDKAFTVEKNNKVSKPAIVSSGNVELSSPVPGEFQSDASSANPAVPTIPNKRCFSGHSNACGHYGTTIVHSCHYPHNALSKVSNIYEAPRVKPEPNKDLLSDTTNPCSSRTSSGKRTKSRTKPFIATTPDDVNANLKRKRAYISLSSDSDSDTVEKKNIFSEPAIMSSGNVKLSSPAPQQANGELQTDMSSANPVAPTISNERCFYGQHPNVYGHYGSTIVHSYHYPHKVSNPYKASRVSSEPNKDLLSDTTNSSSSCTSSGKRTKPTTKPFITPTPDKNSNLKRKRAYITFSSDSDSDSNWTTLPSKLKKRFVKPESLLPFSRTATTDEQRSKRAVKSSGRFKLPIPIPIRELSSSSSSKTGTDEAAESESGTVVAASTSTEKLSSGRRLTLYKPPARDVTRMPGEKPVILSVRRAGRLDSNLGKAVSVNASASAGRLKEVKKDASVVLVPDSDQNEVNARVNESSAFTPCSSPPFFSSSSPMIDLSMLSYSITGLEKGYVKIWEF